MTDKRCPDCKWSFKPPAPAGLNAPPLQCRRNPPNVSAFMVPGRLQGQAQIVTNASFPPVDATTWCGEFVDKAAKSYNSEGMQHFVDFGRRLYSDTAPPVDHFTSKPNMDEVTTPEQPQAMDAKTVVFGSELAAKLVKERMDHANKFTSRVPTQVPSADLD